MHNFSDKNELCKGKSDMFFLCMSMYLLICLAVGLFFYLSVYFKRKTTNELFNFVYINVFSHQTVGQTLIKERIRYTKVHKDVCQHYLVTKLRNKKINYTEKITMVS